MVVNVNVDADAATVVIADDVAVVVVHLDLIQTAEVLISF